MAQISYLYGQLLKLSDELHMLYCLAERNNSLPSQLVGNSFYKAAQNTPRRTLAQLGLHMVHYLNWANLHRYSETLMASHARWRFEKLLTLYETVADQLKHQSLPARFNEEEKSQFFLGYVSSLPNISAIRYK